MRLRPANLQPLTDTDTDSQDSEASDQSDNCDVSSTSSCDDAVFKCEYKISQSMEQAYCSLSGAPLMSFRFTVPISGRFGEQAHILSLDCECVSPQSGWRQHSKAPSFEYARSVAMHGTAAKTARRMIGYTATIERGARR